MLRFSQSQMAQCDALALPPFYRRVASYLREDLPDLVEDFSQDELIDHVEDCHRIALWLGVNSETGVVKVACLSLGPHRDFYEEPDIHHYITEPGADPESRLDNVIEALECA